MTDEGDRTDSGQQGDFAGAVGTWWAWGDPRVIDRLRVSACPLRTP